jgi:methyl-accepting chemotaxis protein
MIKDFYAHYPVRKKFDVILIVLLILTAIPLAASVINLSSGESVALGEMAAELAVMISVAAFMVYSKKAICDPYVTTVVRMEALASGDLDSPVAFTDHGDCVGRMTKAMMTFKGNAIERVNADTALRLVVSEITTGLQHMKSGNLTYSIDKPFGAEFDSLRQTFNDTMGQLCQLLTQTSTAANNVLTGASEIRSASDDLAQRTEQQAASLEESAAAMREVTGMVQQTAQNASEVGKQVGEAHTAATDGGHVVRRAVDAMGAIQKSSGQITNIIDVIDGIAFQTNLLALNAGVEAARAGDAGKGFAVVANEVRALAQRSADAAKDIKELITASTAGVSDGVALVDETGSVLLQISDRVAAINVRIAEISSSTQTQAVRLQQVNLAVSEMDKMTQQNAAMVEESNAAARSLAEEATDLSQVVQRFSAGQTPATKAAPAPARPVARRAPAARSMPMVSGNLALRVEETQDDWSEF